MTSSAVFDAALAGKKLLREARGGALATLMPSTGDPYCSLVNVATAADGAPLMLLSGLALHTKNILADARASLMLDERRADDPLAGARIMLTGQVTATDDADARRRYLGHQPEAEAFAGFTDFSVYRMTIARAHLVAGFGRIVDIAPAELMTDIADAQALVAAEAGIVSHMNEDHADALALYATRLLGARAGAWRCAGCDPEGLDLQLDRTALRLRFPERVTTPEAVRKVLVRLVGEARAKPPG